MTTKTMQFPSSTLKPLAAASLAACLTLPGLASAERLTLTGLQAQIQAVEGQVTSVEGQVVAVEGQVQEVETIVCGGTDRLTCADETQPSVRERIQALETENQQLQDSLCELAAATGATLSGCGPVQGDLRLAAGAAPNEGRLEIFVNDQWGTVCDDRWDINDAAVACRQLGFPGVITHLILSQVVSGTGPINLDDVQCLGNEARLLDCSHRLPTGTHNCSHFEDAGVRCQPLP